MIYINIQPKMNKTILYSVLLTTMLGISVVVLINYYNQHREIIKFIQKKTAPYIADHIYLYAKGPEFVRIKKNLRNYQLERTKSSL